MSNYTPYSDGLGSRAYTGTAPPQKNLLRDVSRAPAMYQPAPPQSYSVSHDATAPEAGRLRQAESRYRHPQVQRMPPPTQATPSRPGSMTMQPEGQQPPLFPDGAPPPMPMPQPGWTTDPGMDMPQDPERGLVPLPEQQQFFPDGAPPPMPMPQPGEQINPMDPMMAYQQRQDVATGYQEQPLVGSNDNTLKYIGIGLGLLAVAGTGYYFWTKRKEE